MDYEMTMQMLLDQEQELQFKKFSNKDAWEIGRTLVERAMDEGKVVTIDIARNGHQLFHYAMPGTTPDNDEWIERKKRVVNRFNHSSHYMSMKLASQGLTIEEKYLLSESMYAAHGGSFPIIIKDTGVIGTITVSGMPSAEDHKMVVDVIKAYLD